jgi:nicotinamidase-related amidase
MNKKRLLFISIPFIIAIIIIYGASFKIQQDQKKVAQIESRAVVIEKVTSTSDKTIVIDNITFPDNTNLHIDNFTVPAGIKLIIKTLTIPETSTVNIENITIPSGGMVVLEDEYSKADSKFKINSMLSGGNARIVNNYFSIRGKQVKEARNAPGNSRNISLMVRKSIPAGSDNSPELRRDKLEQCVIEDVTERDNTKALIQQDVNIDKTALILIDVWECHYNKGWLDRAKIVTRTKIIKLVELAREYGIPVVYVSYNTALSKELSPKPGELVTDDLEEIIQFLQKKNITTLIYAGFSTNYCLLFRPAGIVNMNQNYFFNVIAVRDATVAFEMPETLEKEHAKEVSIDIIEFMLGATTTVQDLQTALKALKKNNKGS